MPPVAFQRTSTCAATTEIQSERHFIIAIDRAPRKVDRAEVADRAEVDGDGRAEVDGDDRAEVDGDFEAVEGAQRGMSESASRSPV